jgi:PTH1 family peptidyl-tRNA hydrolase
MKIIVGLGNPGLRYRRTRHNLGFMAVTQLLHQRGLRLRRGRFRGSQAEAQIGKEPVLFLLPHTYMNLSGHAVSAALHHANCPLHDLLVVCDDINLDLGRLRLRRQGSPGGHKGLESITQLLHSQAFPRLRLGIGPLPPDLDLITYVLSPFPRRDWPLVRDMLDRAAQALETWIYHGLEEAMNRFNSLTVGQPDTPRSR